MKPVHIDFAAAAAAGHRTHTKLWLLVPLLCGALAVAGGLAGQGFAAQADALRAQTEDLQLARAALRSAAEHQEQLAPNVADSINGAIRMLDYPALDLLGTLERHARQDVAVMALEMGPVRSSFRLVVEAPGLPQALDYLEALQREPGFANLALIRQEAGGEGAGQWRFTLEMPQADAVPRALNRSAGRGQE